MEDVLVSQREEIRARSSQNETQRKPRGEEISPGPQQPHESLPEMGYVVLEECNLSIIGTPVDKSFPVDQWIGVEVVKEKSSGKENASFSLESSEDDVFRDDICRHCNLAMHCRQDDKNLLYVYEEDVPFFDGLARNMLHRGCQSPKRSDASLLLGLLRACRDVVAICRIRVRFRDEQYQRASLVVTLAFPFLFQGKPGERSILAPRKTKSFNKPLHPGLQLLLSIIRSDWRSLDSILQNSTIGSEQHDPKSSRQPPPSFFPSKLSLEELYLRIQGSATAQMMDDEQHDAQLLKQSRECYLVQLPKDILAEKIAPFLKPRSLDSLRRSCSYLHNTLRAVVPGLKLRLYSHQITSLSWMRSRECKLITEQDCTGPDTAGCPDGDLHRALTGGHSVLLMLRSGDSSQQMRINQYTGREIPGEDLEKLPRAVARGGLLCDDPGLGKTITVLSLILQSAGLSTIRKDDDRKKNAVPASEDIFYTYWKEQMTADFRRPTLLKLVNDFVRRVSGARHVFVSVLRSKIAADKYGDDFRRFETDAM